MKILYIGTFGDKEIEKIINEKSPIYKPSVAASKYARLISEGLFYNVKGNLTNLLLLPMGMFPQCKLFFFFKKKQWVKETGILYYIPFVNVLFIKQLSILLYVFYFAFKWNVKYVKEEERVIIISSLYLPFLIGLSVIKFFFKVKVISFVPDLPQYMFTYTKNAISLKSLLIPVYIFSSSLFVKIIDFYVYCTEHMKEIFHSGSYIVIEGFVDEKEKDLRRIEKNDPYAIMYAGGMFEKYGIKLLLDAFVQLDNNYELWLFGIGDMVQEVERYANRDKRIKFFGYQPNHVILEYEKKAMLLVNPRFTANDFTKYSFPSKLLEYMFSGTIVLTSRLKGIPSDYENKMYFLQEETVECLKETISVLLEKPRKELESKGKEVQEYVWQEKNNHVQIAYLIENLIKKQA